MKVAVYLRVSTKEQNVEAQRRELTEWASRAGHEIVAEYKDEGVSGTNQKRPGFRRMLKAAAKRKFHLVAVWDIDRLGRSAAAVLKAIADLQGYKIDVFIYKKGIDTSTPAGEMVAAVSALVAKWELELLKQRTRAGIETARRKGKQIGRPFANKTREGKRCDIFIRDMLRDEKPIREIKTRLGVGQSRIERVRNGIGA